MDGETREQPGGGFGREAPTPGRRSAPLREPGAIPRWITIAIGTVVLVLVTGGALMGLRRYLATGKTAEARIGVIQIAHGAAETYERTGKLCPSVLRPVPARRETVAGNKYQSLAAEWRDARFDCVGFEIAGPQYYRYDYQAYGDRFEATAEGDLEGNGTWETFVMRGEIVDGKVKLASSVEQRASRR